MSNHPPIDVLRSGALKATVWENESQSSGEPYYAVTFSKTYRDADGRLADSNAFVGADILVLSHLATQAFSRTNELRQQHMSERDDADDHEPKTGTLDFERGARGRRRDTRAPR